MECVKKVLENTPPELSADIPTALADDPLSCVALGTGKALDAFDKIEKTAMNTSFKSK